MLGQHHLAGVLHVAGANIGGDDIVPQSHGHENMRRHVLRVPSTWSDLRVGACGLETQWGVHRIIEGVNDVVDCARVPGWRRTRATLR